MVSEEKVKQISDFYEKYGMGTLLVGRFIPWGKKWTFLNRRSWKNELCPIRLFNLIACTISCTLFLIFILNLASQSSIC